MSNYVKYQDKIAFHPGYYISEIVRESGLTQGDFANSLGITQDDLCRLMKGEQDLTPDIAIKLSRLLGTSVEYWLNLQSAYDAIVGDLNDYTKWRRKYFDNIDPEDFNDAAVLEIVNSHYDGKDLLEPLGGSFYRTIFQQQL